MQWRLANKKGVSVVEALVGVSLFAVITIFLVQALALYFNNADLLRQKTKATYLAIEGQEFVRYIRDEDWGTLAGYTVGSTYYLDIDPTTVVLSGTPDVIEGTYTRTVRLDRAYRNGSDDLVASTAPGATNDPENRMVVVTVSWGSGQQVVLESLLTNIFDI